MNRFKKFLSVLISCAAAASFCSCGEASSNITDADTSAPEVNSDAAPSEDQAVIDRAILSTGNNFRLKEKIKKLRNGEDLTFAYIGGSITEGAGAPTKDKCWAALSFSRLSGKSADDPHFINAGLSGTPSLLGNLRLERDVLSASPDIVFVEFAVNDYQDQNHRESYESLINTVLSQENEPAVILVFFRLEKGYSCQQHMSEIGASYDLPMISVNDAITEEINAGRLKWEEYSIDYAHPNEFGHDLAANMVCELFDRIEKEEPDEKYTVPEKICFGKAYENALMMTPSFNTDCEFITVEDTGCFKESTNSGVNMFRESWHSDGSSDEPMKIKAKGNSFFVIYKRNKTETMGSVDVIINGLKLKTINSYDKDGWGDPFTADIIRFTDVKDMEIEIKPAPNSDGKEFDILGFGISENTVE